MALLLLIKLNLRLYCYLFCLFIFVCYIYKTTRPSVAETKNQESIIEVPPNGHLQANHAGAAPVIRSRRVESFSNSDDYSVHNFSTTTVIRPYVGSYELFNNTVASLQWIGSPPYHVSHIPLQLNIAPLIFLLLLYTFYSV